MISTVRTVVPQVTSCLTHWPSPVQQLHCLLCLVNSWLRSANLTGLSSVDAHAPLHSVIVMLVAETHSTWRSSNTLRSSTLVYSLQPGVGGLIGIHWQQPVKSFMIIFSSGAQLQLSFVSVSTWCWPFWQICCRQGSSGSVHFLSTFWHWRKPYDEHSHTTQGLTCTTTCMSTSSPRYTIWSLTSGPVLSWVGCAWIQPNWLGWSALGVIPVIDWYSSEVTLHTTPGPVVVGCPAGVVPT